MLANGVMSQCGSDRFEGTITKLTNKLMRFEYDEPITLNENAPNDGLIKGHIYTKE